jgi:hypothetical protein
VSAVKPQYGPSLVQMLAPRPLAVRLAAGALAVALVVALVTVALRRNAGETLVLEHTPVTFNFAYGPQFKRIQTAGTVVSLAHDRGGLFLDSYVVRDLELPPYKGAAGGMLPVYAYTYLKGLRKRYGGFAFVSEGRTRINNGIGYEVTFRARRAGRTLYGRHLLLVQDTPDGLRRGVIIELTSTSSAGTPNADEIGNHGALKQPLRSFRFGADRTGGTA